MRNNTQVRNIEPFHAEIKNVRLSGFQIWFYSSFNDGTQRKYITKITFKYYWLNFLAKMLWEVQAKNEKDVKRQAESLTNKNG